MTVIATPSTSTRFTENGTAPNSTVASPSGGGLSVAEVTDSADFTVTDDLAVGATASTGSTTILTTQNANALTVGRQGATAPALNVDTATASSATGIKITAAAAAGGIDISAISSGTNENITINAKGSGTITLAPTSTGAVTITPATTITGALTPTGGVAAAGGFTYSPRNVHTGGNPASASTDGTNLSIVVTELYVAECQVLANCTVTGVAVFWGDATEGNAKVALYDSAGTRVAISASTDVSGFTTDSYGTRIAFSAPYAAKGPATYYVGVICDTNTNRINTHVLGNFGAGKITGLVYATEAGYATISVPTTFTTGLGPIATLY